MKKMGLMIIAVSLSLSVAALAAEKSTNTQTPSQSQTAPAAKGKGRGMAQTPKMLADEIAKLKQEHQAVINELEEIKKLAAEEKATKTAAAVDKLITKKNQEFQKKIEPQETQLKKLQEAQKGGDDKGGKKSAPKKKG